MAKLINPKYVPHEVNYIHVYITDFFALAMSAIGNASRTFNYDIFYQRELNLFVIAYTDDLYIERNVFCRMLEETMFQNGIKVNYVLRKVETLQVKDNGKDRAFVPHTF